MAATAREISEIFQWLQSSHHVTVNHDWLEACISWLKETAENRRAHTNVPLRDEVYYQWLICDLSESGSSILPPAITTASKCFLQGFLPLQMSSIVNVGESAYSQLKKLKGDDKSEDDSTPKFGQPTPTRMLMLKLTDGDQIVQGMEYKPIKLLHSGLVPGTKILIKGSPMCSRGIIFLTEDNIKILGGQVQGLIEENSQMNVLQQLVMKGRQPGEQSIAQSHEIGSGPLPQGGETMNPLENREAASRVGTGYTSRSMNRNPNPQQNSEMHQSRHRAMIPSDNRRQNHSDVGVKRPMDKVPLDVRNLIALAYARIICGNQNEVEKTNVIDEDLSELMNDDDDILLADLNSNDIGLTDLIQSEPEDLMSMPVDICNGIDETDDLSDEIMNNLIETETVQAQPSFQKTVNPRASRNQTMFDKSTVNFASNFIDLTDDDDDDDFELH